MSISSAENPQHKQTPAAAFAEEFLEPIAADLDRGGNFPRALVAELGRRQLLTVKPSGFAAHVEALQSFAQSCPAVATIVNQHALAAYAISKWGGDAVKTALAPALANGEQLGALAVVESGPGLGLGPDALIATRSGGKITLNGGKIFVRNAGVADVFVGFASMDGAIIGFIAPANTPGISIGAQYTTMGLRGCPVADVTFKKIVLDDSYLLGAATDGPAILAELLGAQALGEAAVTVGIGKAAARHAAAAARHRIQFGHPIASLQAIQQLLAEIATDAHLAWLGIRHAAQLLDAGAPFAVEAAMVQSWSGRFGQKMLIDAIQVEGGMGICETAPPHFPGTLPLARLFRDMAGTTLLDAPADFPEALIAASL
jgi:alkylation response protein AidB-like acyl-CoA dehydrogenase